MSIFVCVFKIAIVFIRTPLCSFIRKLYSRLFQESWRNCPSSSALFVLSFVSIFADPIFNYVFVWKIQYPFVFYGIQKNSLVCFECSEMVDQSVFVSNVWKYEISFFPLDTLMQHCRRHKISTKFKFKAKSIIIF